MAALITDLTDEDIRTTWHGLDDIVASDDDASDTDDDASDADDDSSDSDADQADR